MTKKINEATDPMNPTIEIPGYGVVDLSTLEMMLMRHFKEYTDIASKATSYQEWNNIKSLLDDGVMQLKLTTLVDAYRDLENKRRRGGPASRGIDKGRTERLWDSEQNPVEEGYSIQRPIDRERYTDIPGLEGPMMLRNGQVVYYDPHEGKYYDRDTDMYISDDEYFAADRNKPFEQVAESMVSRLKRQAKTNTK